MCGSNEGTINGKEGEEQKNTNSKVGVDRRKEGSANAVVSVLFEGDVSTIVVTEFLCEAKIDDIDKVGAMAGAHDEVGRFYVVVDKVVRIDEFNMG